MSYFCFVPDDAKDKEHLTIAWRQPSSPGLTEGLTRSILEQANRLCPFYGVVAVEEEFHLMKVQLIRVPHNVHVMRFVCFDSVDESNYMWSPHITKCQERKLGDIVRFVRAEFRPDGY